MEKKKKKFENNWKLKKKMVVEIKKKRTKIQIKTKNNLRFE